MLKRVPFTLVELFICSQSYVRSYYWYTGVRSGITMSTATHSAGCLEEQLAMLIRKTDELTQQLASLKEDLCARVERAEEGQCQMAAALRGLPCLRNRRSCLRVFSGYSRWRRNSSRGLMCAKRHEYHVPQQCWRLFHLTWRFPGTPVRHSLRCLPIWMNENSQRRLSILPSVWEDLSRSKWSPAENGPPGSARCTCCNQSPVAVKYYTTMLTLKTQISKFDGTVTKLEKNLGLHDNSQAYLQLERNGNTLKPYNCLNLNTV